MYRLPLVCLGFLVLSNGALYAQQQEKVAIKHVTVFLNGAELENTARVSLPAGGGEVLFTNIAGEINAESINIGTDNGSVLIQSVTFEKDYLGASVLSPLAQSYKDSITIITAQKQQLENRMAVINEQIAVLKANEKVGGNNTGLSITELQKMLELVNTKLAVLLDDKTALELKIKKQGEYIAKLTQQLEQERSKSSGQLLVKFYNLRATDAKINITYVTENASWEPAYDIRAEKIGAPLALTYKATVKQNTGINWDNVHVTISTGNPIESATAPVYNPNYLSFFQIRTIRGDVNAMVPGEMRMMAKSADAAVAAAPVVENEVVKFTPTTSAVATNYDIDVPYTIPSDDLSHLIVMNTTDIPAHYNYFTYPKADPDAFLQAQITKWEDLNLLPGNANIFYAGTYVGQSYLSVSNVKDTLAFSLGRDKKIVIKRDRDTKLRSTKTIGSNVREQYGYTITVRNTHTQPVEIAVIDQVPVTTEKEISVEDIDTGGGNYNETTGEVNWHITLNANEVRELKLGYTIKYPKGKILNNH